MKEVLAKPPCVDFDELDGAPWSKPPLHVLTARDYLRRSSKKLVCHVWSGDLPEGAILDTGKGFYVGSPELCFLEMANHLALPKLIELGFEFCGTYDTFYGDIREVPPLTTTTKLLSFVSKMRSADGSSKVLSALRFVIEGSGSPMETILTMLLCLPYKMGGYGIAKPFLNYRIDIPSKLARRISRNFYVCDLYWSDSKTAVEYDSDLFHTGADRIARDSIRRNDLSSLGISTLSMTNHQIKDRKEFDRFAQLIAARTGKRLRYSEPNFSQACLELRKELLGLSNRCYGTKYEQ